jgi:diguanylate cyclase (GGDEF)-like protein
MIAPIVRITLVQWRVRPGVLHRRVLSAASLGLSFGAASVTFHGLSRTLTTLAPGSVGRSAAWLGFAVAAALVQSALNKMIIMTAVKGGDPSERVVSALLRREPLYNDLAELCIGLLVVYGVASNPFLAPVALPIIALLHRSLRHAQLLNASRTDAKTGLLNARTWEREAAAEVTRAVRARLPLAVAVLDIDWFKHVNDTYGHLFGDEALKEIAHCLPGVLREYDSAGRFGGEEFVLLLPHTRAVDAFRIADRVRDHVSGLSLLTADGQSVQITVSVGVAALDAGSRRELSELLAAADAALYRAKRDGRNQVQMISTARGLSAAGGRGGNGSGAFGGAPAVPTGSSAWDVLPTNGHGSASDGHEVAAGVLARPKTPG